MKLSFNFKEKEANLEADVEGIVKKGMDQKEKLPPRKTRYQIRQEEKRKNKELEHKLMVRNVLLILGVLVAIVLICALGAALSW